MTTTDKDVSCILLWLQGGISHIDCFDPKPEAPSEIRGEFSFIDTVLPVSNSAIPCLNPSAPSTPMVQEMGLVRGREVRGLELSLSGDNRALGHVVSRVGIEANKKQTWVMSLGGHNEMVEIQVILVVPAQKRSIVADRPGEKLRIRDPQKSHVLNQRHIVPICPELSPEA